jgi:hypothetical protein
VGKGSSSVWVIVGIKDSSGPREGVVAVKVPDGLAVRKVPLFGY